MRPMLWSVLLLFAATAYGQKTTTQTSAVFLNRIPQEKPVKFTYKTFELDNHTFGYEIFAGGIVLLHQEDMPGKPAGTGFTSINAASRTAERVILKLERPVVPPVVTAGELQLLGIR